MCYDKVGKCIIINDLVSGFLSEKQKWAKYLYFSNKVSHVFWKGIELTWLNQKQNTISKYKC